MPSFYKPLNDSVKLFGARSKERASFAEGNGDFIHFDVVNKENRPNILEWSSTQTFDGLLIDSGQSVLMHEGHSDIVVLFEVCFLSSYPWRLFIALMLNSDPVLKIGSRRGEIILPISSSISRAGLLRNICQRLTTHPQLWLNKDIKLQLGPMSQPLYIFKMSKVTGNAWAADIRYERSSIN
ncbi:hypothetical protein CVT26_006568 [Gymnopilus dilepis]|uniref:Uncharacterized protein n=1 Tax=Gymnopilus dilepis TaxID=231916 RepID=A0A409Y2R5_9AGAR|nr:hypothetical protein CVT26_006568 [Gymnopilus dilepis]